MFSPGFSGGGDPGNETSGQGNETSGRGVKIGGRGLIVSRGRASGRGRGLGAFGGRGSGEGRGFGRGKGFRGRGRGVGEEVESVGNENEADGSEQQGTPLETGFGRGRGFGEGRGFKVVAGDGKKKVINLFKSKKFGIPIGDAPPSSLFISKKFSTTPNETETEIERAFSPAPLDYEG